MRGPRAAGHPEHYWRGCCSEWCLAGYANFFSAIQSILQANAPHPTAAIMSRRTMVKLGGLVELMGIPKKPHHTDEAGKTAN